MAAWALRSGRVLSMPCCRHRPARRMFETFSYLPPLSDDQIARQVDYIVNNGWTPCLEFSEPENAYVQSVNTSRFGAVSAVRARTGPAQPGRRCGAACAPPGLPAVRNCAMAARPCRAAPPSRPACPQFRCCLQNYFDNRYWTMWKLPMFGCTDPVQVIAAARGSRDSRDSCPTQPWPNAAPMRAGTRQCRPALRAAALRAAAICRQRRVRARPCSARRAPCTR